MKYDIAKNEEGPLRSTLRTAQTPSTKDPVVSACGDILETRFRDVEDHLAVRYGALKTEISSAVWHSNTFPSSPITPQIDHRQAEVPGRSHHSA